MNRRKHYSYGTTSKSLHFGMLACCAIMMVPLAVYFARGGTISGLKDSLGVIAPLLICIGAHGAMYLVMGRTCHETDNEAETKTAQSMDVASTTSTDS